MPRFCLKTTLFEQFRTIILRKYFFAGASRINKKRKPMRNLLIIFSLLLSLGFVNSEQNREFELRISLLDRPDGLITNYKLTKDNLIISSDYYFWLNESEKPKEKIIFQREILGKDKTFIFEAMEKLDFDKKFEEIYFNKCIIDGLEIFINVEEKGIQYSTSVHNYYEPRINNWVLGQILWMKPGGLKAE